MDRDGVLTQITRAYHCLASVLPASRAIRSNYYVTLTSQNKIPRLLESLSQSVELTNRI